MGKLADSLQEFNNNIKSFTIFMEHPFLNTAKFLLTSLVAGSKPICLFGAVASVVLYIMGFDNCAKYTLFFCLLFFLIQCIGLVL